MRRKSALAILVLPVLILSLFSFRITAYAEPKEPYAESGGFFGADDGNFVILCAIVGVALIAGSYKIRKSKYSDDGNEDNAFCAFDDENEDGEESLNTAEYENEDNNI